MTKCDDTELEQYRFHQYKQPILIENIYVDELVVSNKISLGKNDFKYFIGYKDTKKKRSLYIFVPKMNAYRRDFDQPKCMSFFNKR